jgi:RimJ/RimL family protein N-acetyltransferase
MSETDADGLRTERLILRRWQVTDLAPFARINSDPDVVQFLGSAPLSETDTRALMDRIEEHWKKWGYGLWALDLSKDARMIGFIGLTHHKWYPDDVEIGWRLDPAYWGRGLATEGATAALDHGFTILRIDRVISVIHRDNLASRRVAEKIGLTLWKETNEFEDSSGDELPIVVYALDRS